LGQADADKLPQVLGVRLGAEADRRQLDEDGADQPAFLSRAHGDETCAER
jgi:hypothetical protein